MPFEIYSNATVLSAHFAAALRVDQPHRECQCRDSYSVSPIIDRLSVVACVFSYDVIAFELKRFNQFDSPLSLIAGRHSKRVSIAAILPNRIASTFIEVCDPFLFSLFFYSFFFSFFFDRQSMKVQDHSTFTAIVFLKLFSFFKVNFISPEKWFRRLVG